MTTKSRLQALLAALLCSAAVAGCAPTLSNRAREVEVAVPDTFAGHKDGSSSAAIAWKQFFRDPQLISLIEAALENNQELNIALQEIAITRFEVMATKGEYLPKINGQVGVGLDKISEDTSQGRSDEALELSNPLQDYLLGFHASWEVDVWKKLRNATKAASLRYLASVEGRNFMVTMLVAEIAGSYYELVALDNQLEVVKGNVDILQSALDVVRLQKEAAEVTELAVQRFEAEVLKNQSRQYAILQEIVETENRINFLVGRFPQPVERSSKGFTDIVPVGVHVGVPSQLLSNRPDVRQAELLLQAAKLDVKVARARFYPSLEIGGALGLQSFDLTSLLHLPGSLLYNVSAELLTPLWNRKELKAGYGAANARQMAAVLEYERTVLKAYAEASNQLSNIKNLEKSYELRSEQVEILTKSIEVSSILFQSARADYMEVLMTRREALESQMELIETKLEQMEAMVHLYQALGGGWQEDK